MQLILSPRNIEKAVMLSYIFSLDEAISIDSLRDSSREYLEEIVSIKNDKLREFIDERFSKRTSIDKDFITFSHTLKSIFVSNQGILDKKLFFIYYPSFPLSSRDEFLFYLFNNLKDIDLDRYLFIYLSTPFFAPIIIYKKRIALYGASRNHSYIVNTLSKGIDNAFTRYDFLIPSYSLFVNSKDYFIDRFGDEIFYYSAQIYNVLLLTTFNDIVGLLQDRGIDSSNIHLLIPKTLRNKYKKIIPEKINVFDEIYRNTKGIDRFLGINNDSSFNLLKSYILKVVEEDQGINLRGRKFSKISLKRTIDKCLYAPTSCIGNSCNNCSLRKSFELFLDNYPEIVEQAISEGFLLPTIEELLLRLRDFSAKKLFSNESIIKAKLTSVEPLRMKNKEYNINHFLRATDFFSETSLKDESFIAYGLSSLLSRIDIDTSSPRSSFGRAIHEFFNDPRYVNKDRKDYCEINVFYKNKKISGRVDALLKQRIGNSEIYTIVDLKTGLPSKSHLFQLMSYMLALDELFGREVNYSLLLFHPPSISEYSLSNFIISQYYVPYSALERVKELFNRVADLTLSIYSFLSHRDLSFFLDKKVLSLENDSLYYSFNDSLIRIPQNIFPLINHLPKEKASILRKDVKDIDRVRQELLGLYSLISL